MHLYISATMMMAYAKKLKLITWPTVFEFILLYISYIYSYNSESAWCVATTAALESKLYRYIYIYICARCRTLWMSNATRMDGSHMRICVFHVEGRRRRWRQFLPSILDSSLVTVHRAYASQSRSSSPAAAARAHINQSRRYTRNVQRRTARRHDCTHTV